MGVNVTPARVSDAARGSMAAEALRPPAVDAASAQTFSVGTVR